MKINKKKMGLTAVIVLVLLLVLWAVWVFRLNRFYRDRDEIPVENYGMNEFVSFDNNYTYGSYANGFSLRVNDYEILDTDTYLARFGKTPQDYPSAYERVCVVDITLRYDLPEDDAVSSPPSTFDDSAQELAPDQGAIDLAELSLCGLDYYLGQNWDLYHLENPEMDGALGLILSDGEEYHVRLVYNILERFISPYYWNHMDRLPMMLFLTAYPVQKNIVLQ